MVVMAIRVVEFSNGGYKIRRKLLNFENRVSGEVRDIHSYRVLQTIQMKLILLWVWAERAVLSRAKTALKFKYEI